MVKKVNKITLDDIAQKIDSYRSEVISFKVDLKEELSELKDKVNHLPTKEEYYACEVKTVTELQTIII